MEKVLKLERWRTQDSPQKEKRKAWTHAIIIIALLLSFIFVGIPSAQASAIDRNVYVSIVEPVNEILAGISSVTTTCFSSEPIIYDGDTEESESFMTTLNNLDWTKDIFIATESIGMVMIFFLLAFRMMESIHEGAQNPMDTFIKVAIEFFLALFLMVNTSGICDAIDKVGDWTISTISEAISSEDEMADYEVYNFLSDEEPDWEAIEETPGGSYYINVIKPKYGDCTAHHIMHRFDAKMSIIPFKILATIIRLMAYAICFAVIIEIKIRRMLAPIAIAQIVNGGMRSSGVQFLKKYLACWVNGAFLQVIGIISAAVTVTVGGNFAMVVAISLAGLGLMAKSSQFVNEAIAG